MGILKNTLDFKNTKIAFATQSNFELRKAYYLFWFFGFPKLVNFATKLAVWALSWRLPIQFFIRHTVFEQFCGGETIENCEKALKKLEKNKIGAILDYSVEGKEEETIFKQTVEEMVKTLEAAAKNRENIPFSVFKFTGICRFSLLEKVSTGNVLSPEETTAFHQLIERVNTLCKRAFTLGVPILIDAEESWIQDAIDKVAHQMMEKYNKEKPIVYNTIQLYRHDRLAFLKAAVATAQKEKYHYAAKLVRGAYMEKERERALKMNYPSPIQKDKTHTDADYDAALKFCIENKESVAICAGSHNEESNYLLAELMIQNNIAKEDKNIYFAQLYGMSDHISCNLANAGYRVAKYLPYGAIAEVIPYLTRRAAENTSTSEQMGRELQLLTQEIERRNKES